MVPRAPRSGSFSTPFGEAKSSGEKRGGRRKGLVSCPPYEPTSWCFILGRSTPIPDKHVIKGSKEFSPRILSLYIFLFFRDETSCFRPLRELAKEISGNIAAFSISRNKLCVSSYVFHPLIVFCLPKNQYSGRNVHPSTLGAALNGCQSMFHCVCARSMSRSLKISPLFCSDC